jgi:hypothetical protein
MIKKNEIFFQIVDTNPAGTVPPASFARANQNR